MVSLLIIVIDGCCSQVRRADSSHPCDHILIETTSSVALRADLYFGVNDRVLATTMDKLLLPGPTTNVSDVHPSLVYIAMSSPLVGSYFNDPPFYPFV